MQTTTIGVESWNRRWANSLSTNLSIYLVIRGFMNEDALARSKFQEVVAGRATNPNPSSKGRRTERLDMLKLSLKSYKRSNRKSSCLETVTQFKIHCFVL